MEPGNVFVGRQRTVRNMTAKKEKLQVGNRKQKEQGFKPTDWSNAEAIKPDLHTRMEHMSTTDGHQPSVWIDMTNVSNYGSASNRRYAM